MVFKSWTTTIITTKTNLTTQTIWTTATIQAAAITQAMQAAVQIPAITLTTLERTQALTAAQALPKTNNSVEPLPESSRPRKDGPGGE